MKYRRLLSALLATLMLSAIYLLPVAATESTDMLPVPQIEATAALLLELNSGTVLFEQNADERVYPASLTKIMTCFLTLEMGSLSDTVTVSEAALENLDVSGSSAGLLAGETMSLENLLYCMMLSSANEACNVAAEHVAGSIDAFVQLMNERATQLGCTGTHFVNTHGLHDEDHYTTARDLSLIAQAAMENHTFRTIVSTASYVVPETNMAATRKLSTTNQLIIPKQGNIYYDDRVTGIKTGFTTPAGRCLAATAEDGTLSLLSIVCGCDTRILESGDLEFASFPETEKLLDYGFMNFTFQTVLTTLYPVAEIPVSRSAGANFVSLAPKDEITALLPSDYDESNITFTATLVSNEGVSAPVAAGDELGSITLSYNGKELGSTKLVAITSVERATLLTYLNPSRYATQAWLRIVLLILIGLCLLLIVLNAVRKHAKKKQEQKQRRLRRMQRTSEHNLGSNDWFERE